MNNELHKAFNETVHRYRNSLVYYARKCDWDTFKVIAGKLFDYVETIEAAELKRRFFKNFGLVMVVLFCMLVFVLSLDPNSSPGIERLKRVIFLAAIGGSGFEFFFFMNFRIYMKYKSELYKSRKERFIRDIEGDFRDMCLIEHAQSEVPPVPALSL